MRYVQNRPLWKLKRLIWATIRTALGNELTPECLEIRMRVFAFVFVFTFVASAIFNLDSICVA